jgi:DNA invertase Pin-like site-specific DNA recombinase
MISEIDKNQPLTTDQLVEFVLNELDARSAQRMRGLDYSHKCTTPVITSVRTEQSIVELSVQSRKVGSRTVQMYGAIYARVSTEAQNAKNKRLSVDDIAAGRSAVKDSLSMRDQVTRGINFCVDKGVAFRIYSDAEISGGDPPDNPDLIKELYTMKAEKYMAAIEAVFLSEYNTLRTPEEKARVREYMRENIAEILHRSGEADAAWERMFEIELRKKPLTYMPKTQISFRPALTLLMADLEDNIHTLVVNEMSRLSRSTALTAKIINTLHRNRIHYVGMVESAHLFRDRSFMGRVISNLKAEEAQEKLYEVCMNTVRDMVALLDSGRPHSNLNFWLERDQWGYGKLKRTPHQRDLEITGEELGRKIINLF